MARTVRIVGIIKLFENRLFLSQRESRCLSDTLLSISFFEKLVIVLASIIAHEHEPQALWSACWYI